MRVGSTSSNSCHKEKFWTQETKGIGSCGDWSDATTNQGMPGATKAV